MARPLSLLLAALLVPSAAFAATAGKGSGPSPQAPSITPPTAADAKRWWSHVEYLASDAMLGRETGSDGFVQAAKYVAERWAALGVQPAGTDGFFQPVRLSSLRTDESKSSLSLAVDGKEQALALGTQVILKARQSTAAPIEAGLVFGGYCLSMPDAGHDDLAGLDLRGKVAVCLSGGPKALSATVRAHGSSWAVRSRALARAGAIGVLSVRTRKMMDIPWERVAQSRHQPDMEHEAVELRDGAPEIAFYAMVNPDEAHRLFVGSGHAFPDLMKRADAADGLPRFPLVPKVKAKLALTRSPVASMNVVGVLPGTDEALRSEYVVLTGHLDHVGKGAPEKGDDIYNGAMDNASGVATLIEVARALSTGERRRSVLLVAFTGEEHGLLGSRLFAVHPTVKGRLVANVNMDMFLPLHPLRRLVAYGMEESTLRAPLEESAKAFGIRLVPDPQPERVLFVRSDQYSFIRTGVPALSFKFSPTPGTKEEGLHRAWYKERYHAPADDLSQPMDKAAAARFTQFLADFSRRVANAPERPRWNETSFFRRFAQAPDRPAVREVPTSTAR